MVILSVTCLLCIFCLFFFFFFFNDTATTEIYTLFPTRRSFDLGKVENLIEQHEQRIGRVPRGVQILFLDRKSTRLNSSHLLISYAVFCLKKTFSVRGRDLGTTVEEAIQRIAEKVKMTPGYRISWSGEYEIFFLIKGRPPSFPPFPYPALFL